MSVQAVFAVEVGDAHARGARPRSSSLRNSSRPCIWPPMQRSAAAASTPSGAPPEPMIDVDAAVRAAAVAITPATSPSVISMMRAPASRTLAISSCMARRGRGCRPRGRRRRTFLAWARLLQVLRRRRRRDRPRRRAGRRRRRSCPCRCRARSGSRPCSAMAITASAFGAALGGDRGAFQRVERDVDLRPARRRPSRRYRASAPRRARPRRSPPCRRWQAFERLAHGVDGGLVGRLLVAAAHPARGGERRGLGHAHQLRAPGCGPSSGSAAAASRSSFLPGGSRRDASAAGSMRIMRGGSSTASSAAIASSARAHRGLVGLVGGQHHRHRLAGRAAALDHALRARRCWSRSAAVTSAITPGRSTTISRR